MKQKSMKSTRITKISMLLLLVSGTAFAQDTNLTTRSLTEEQKAKASQLAKQLANPIASLISMPLQYNYDENYGENDQGSKSQLNIQPVIPLTMNEDWNLITRTILPVIDIKDMPGAGNESGLGDITASQFFSPKAPTQKGWIWGAGIVELIPTATEDALGGGKWGVGPTAVALKQAGPWTIGGLVNQVWSVAGDSDREDISSLFIQPFLAFIVDKTKTTLSLDTESSYNWKNEEWSVPVNISAAQLFKVKGQIMQLQVGARYWVASTDEGPEDWGVRCQLTFLFPK